MRQRSLSRWWPLLVVALASACTEESSTTTATGGAGGSGGTAGTSGAGGSGTPDSGKSGAGGTSDDGGKTDVVIPPGDAGASPCTLDRPTDLDRPPSGSLPCELLPPGFKL
jgi:hypothetical protein